MPIPGVLRRVLASPATAWLACLALASPFLLSGVTKLLDFPGAIGEMAAFNLQPAGPIAAAVIATQIGGSFLFLRRNTCWLGAGILSGFTVFATLMAHRFWEFDGVDRVHQMTTFFEHAALVGGFAVAAMLVNGKR